MALPPELRALLARHLIASLDELYDAENERIWLEEAETRYQEYKKGDMVGRDAFEALAEIRTLLK